MILQKGEHVVIVFSLSLFLVLPLVPMERPETREKAKASHFIIPGGKSSIRGKFEK